MILPLIVAFLIATVVQSETFCPSCHMDVEDAYYVELSYGQKVKTCDMNSGEDYQDGLQSFSHPSQMGYNMSKIFAADDKCTSTCEACEEEDGASLLDPMTGTPVTSDNFEFVCLRYGQKIYFSSAESKSVYVANAKVVPYLMVTSAMCGTSNCPDLFKLPPAVFVATITNDSTAAGPEPFCTGASVMVNGFDSSYHGTCVLLLFQGLLLNSWVKYIFGLIAVFAAAIINEALVKFREKVRVWTVKDQFDHRRDASHNVDRRPSLSIRKYRNKAILTLLYMCQMTLAYFLMLVAMTYESGLFVALVGGFGAGFLLFKNIEQTSDLRDAQLEKNAEFSRRLSELVSPSDATVLDIEGMRCMKNCGTTVRNALMAVEGTTKAEIHFKERKAIIFGTSKSEDLIEAVELVGFGAQVSTDF